MRRLFAEKHGVERGIQLGDERVVDQQLARAGDVRPHVHVHAGIGGAEYELVRTKIDDA